MLEVFDADEALLNRDYYLKAKIIIKENSYQDIQSNSTTLKCEEMAFLIPIESSERDIFYTAWLPDIEVKYTELVALAGNPVNGPIRLALHRPDRRIAKPYLFVMTKSAEEILKEFNNREIELKILSKTKDHEADLQKDFDLAINKNKGSSIKEEVHNV